MDHLKIAFVVILCVPILYFGALFALKLLDNAVANKKSERGR